MKGFKKGVKSEMKREGTWLTTKCDISDKSLERERKEKEENEFCW